MTLTEFLLARLAEDEAVARGASFWSDVSSRLTPRGGLNATYAERFTPELVLAECEAKRRIVENWSDDAHYPNFDGGFEEAMDLVVKRLAAVYADHPDYREEWRP